MLALLPLLLQSPAANQGHELYRAQMAAAEGALRLGELVEARRWLAETEVARRGVAWELVARSPADASWAPRPEGGAPTARGVRPDGEWLACGDASGGVALYALDPQGRAPRERRALGAHAQSVTAVRFERAGKRLLSASLDRTVKVWDIDRRALALELAPHANSVGGADFSPDGSLIASCTWERGAQGVVGLLQLWDASNGALLRTLSGGRKPLVGLAFSPDGRRVAAGSWNFCVFVWETAGSEPVECAMPDEGLYNAVDGVAWSPDGRFVAGASRD